MENEGYNHSDNNIRIDNNPDKKMKNPWMISTLIIGVMVVILLFLLLNNGSVTGKVISGESAGEVITEYLNARVGGGVEYKSFEDIGNLYEITVSYQDQEIPVFTTKDGKYFVQGAVPISESDSLDATDTPSQPQTPQDVPKSNKPSVELYVFTYCPYGTQAEKGIIPVVKLLGDKIDFKIRQIGAMHGEYEKIEAQRQLCINKLYPAKFLDYTLDFALNSEIGNCRGDATCVGPKIDALYSKLGIDKAKIENCMKSDGATLYAAEESNSRSNGVGGSPTLMINGEDVQSGRDSASYLAAICNAFNTKPAECSQTLSSASPSPGFGSGAGNPSSAAQC